MKRTLRYTDYITKYEQCVMVDKITHFSKNKDGNTLIHLTNHMVLVTEDSIKTLEARINKSSERDNYPPSEYIRNPPNGY